MASGHKDSTYGPEFLTAKALATLRSSGVCQFCGLEKGTHGHHWAKRYPKPEDLGPDDLTILCPSCHGIATSIRRNGQPVTFHALLAPLYRLMDLLWKRLDRIEERIK